MERFFWISLLGGLIPEAGAGAGLFVKKMKSTARVAGFDEWPVLPS